MFVDPNNANTTTLQHDDPMATPNAPLGPQWDVPGAIPDMGDLLGVDLHHEFSAEAEQQGRRQRKKKSGSSSPKVGATMWHILAPSRTPSRLILMSLFEICVVSLLNLWYLILLVMKFVMELRFQ
ncbi:hypothetical protein GmHk_09G025831 [Glycine max]|nr:hypothetical protein GmHk_09G025831 [Glycine max]